METPWQRNCRRRHQLKSHSKKSNQRLRRRRLAQSSAPAEKMEEDRQAGPLQHYQLLVVEHLVLSADQRDHLLRPCGLLVVDPVNLVAVCPESLLHCAQSLVVDRYDCSQRHIDLLAVGH